MSWEIAGKAWGARAWDWALLQEQVNANSFDLGLQLTGVGPGVRFLDLACGSGLALRRAEARGAVCHGIDASRGLLDVAAVRAPTAMLHCGDLARLPYADESFDVVTTVNGVQYGSDEVLRETSRVLSPRGRFALAFWSDPGDYAAYFQALAACSPPAPAPALKLSDPGVAAGLVEGAGLKVVERGEHPVVGLYRSTQDAFDALESAGGAWAAIDHSGAEPVRAAINDAIVPFVDQATGHIVMRATMGHLVASKP